MWLGEVFALSQPNALMQHIMTPRSGVQQGLSFVAGVTIQAGHIWTIEGPSCWHFSWYHNVPYIYRISNHIDLKIIKNRPMHSKVILCVCLCLHIYTRRYGTCRLASAHMPIHIQAQILSMLTFDDICVSKCVWGNMACTCVRFHSCRGTTSTHFNLFFCKGTYKYKGVFWCVCVCGRACLSGGISRLAQRCTQCTPVHWGIVCWA